MADHDGNYRCLVDKNVPIALILPSSWQEGAESVGMENPSCPCFDTIGNCQLCRKEKGFSGQVRGPFKLVT